MLFTSTKYVDLVSHSVLRANGVRRATRTAGQSARHHTVGCEQWNQIQLRSGGLLGLSLRDDNEQNTNSTC